MRMILDDKDICPTCGNIIERNVSVGDDFLYDVCIHCGFKRKMNNAGEEISTEGSKDGFCNNHVVSS